MMRFWLFDTIRKWWVYRQLRGQEICPIHLVRYTPIRANGCLIDLFADTKMFTSKSRSYAACEMCYTAYKLEKKLKASSEAAAKAAKALAEDKRLAELMKEAKKWHSPTNT